MTKVYFAGKPAAWERWQGPLERAFREADVPATISPDLPPEDADYVVIGDTSGIDDFGRFTRAKAILGTWAGVEKLAPDPTLTQPLARMVESGMTDGMVDYVCGHVLRHHLDLDADIRRDAPEWAPRVPPLARERKVSVLGLGELGGAAAQALARHGFDVAGWSRRPKTLEGVTCHSGSGGLQTMLARSEILVVLLPLTQETDSILGTGEFAALPRGAILINPARGALIDDGALLAALELGPGRPCHTRHLPAGASAARSSVLASRPGNGDPAHRVRHTARYCGAHHRRERPPRREWRAVPAPRGSPRGVLTGPPSAAAVAGRDPCRARPEPLSAGLSRAGYPAGARRAPGGRQSDSLPPRT